MSLETPNRIAASTVLLFESFPTVGEGTVEFASNNGFASVRFIDLTDLTEGVVLAMDQPVNNQEGAVYLRPDASVEPVPRGYITPNHFETGTTAIDDLAPFQAAVIELAGAVEVFRLSVTVFKMTEVLAPLEGEPVTP